ncbi:hypothetical protein BASA81_003335 [Batrachochytrium salamandrivorans]|nr:hypothetical protein BASA81_003335 [Batrachochytrium salamandrivorans]
MVAEIVRALPLPQQSMRPFPSASLKRRMSGLERALLIAVVLLGLLSTLLFVCGMLLNLNDSQPNHTRFLIPEPHPADGEEFFLPGSLPWNRTQVLHKCHVPEFTSFASPLPYSQGCSKSTKHKIIFHLTPKSGSSTGRHVIKHDFGGIDYHHAKDCQVPSTENRSDWIEMAILRNPATRAFASYEEMFTRRLGSLQSIPASSRRFMQPFVGWEYANYSALFYDPAGVAKLNLAYEEFMQDWDGKAFDTHLESQVAFNLRKQPNGKVDASHLDWVLDTHSMRESFALVAQRAGFSHSPKVIRGRSYPRRLNVSLVSDEAFQAMCRRYKDDFCCLNYVLPPPCLRASLPNTRVRCQHLANGEIQALIV